MFMKFQELISYNRRKLFHVRPVTQGDVIRADIKEISRIFQVGLFDSS